MPHRQHHNARWARDFIERDVPGSAERDDEFSPCRAFASFADAVGRYGQVTERGCADGFDSGLGKVEVSNRLGPVEQEVKEARQVVVGCGAEEASTNSERVSP